MGVKNPWIEHFDFFVTKWIISPLVCKFFIAYYHTVVEIFCRALKKPFWRDVMRQPTTDTTGAEMQNGHQHLWQKICFLAIFDPLLPGVVAWFWKVGGLKSQLEREGPKKSWIEPPYLFPEPPHSGGALERGRGALKQKIFWVLRALISPEKLEIFLWNHNITELISWKSCDRGGGGGITEYSQKVGGHLLLPAPAPLLTHFSKSRS